MDKNKPIRCVNKDTNAIRFFPASICYNEWWQKNTRFIPQELEVIESPIINTSNEMLDVASTNAITNDDAISNEEVKPKRKYKKRKSNGIN